jgi:hypothetical protein
MDNNIVGKRAQDVQAGLRDVEDSIVQSTIPVTRQIGMAALLAVHIRGLERITNIPGLTAFAANLGIRELPMVLHTLSEAGWIRAIPNIWAPACIDETIPHLQALYSTLGEQWAHRRPSELEAASLGLIESLIVGPQPIAAVLDTTALSPEVITTILDIGELGGYFRKYLSPRDRQEILYTPLYMDEHPESLLNCIAKHSDRYGEIHSILTEAKSCPGIPVFDLEGTHPLVAELVNSNVLSAPAVESSGGRHHFLFPHIRTDRSMIVLEKARILVACVRYGERFSTITKVLEPVYLLSKLKQYKVIGKKPHSNIKTQYAGAVAAGIGFIENVGGRFTFHLYDTPENLEAVDLAIDMCSGITESEVHLILDPSSFQETLSNEQPQGIILPASNRSHVRTALSRRRLDRQSQTYKRHNDALVDDLRGVYRVIH